jgi:hypothetical protein
VNVNVGSSLRLRVLLIDSSGTSRDDFAVSYNSIDSDIVTVDGTGTVQGVKQGFSTLALTAGSSIAAATITVTEVGAGAQGFKAIGVTQDASGTLYLASGESHAVLASVDLGQAPQVFAGVDTSPGLVDGERTEAQFSNPTHLSLDETVGALYVSDSANHAIRRIGLEPAGQVAILAGTGVAGSGATGSGEGGFSGDDGPATDARLDVPIDVAVDVEGNLWIADFFNGRVRRVDALTIVIRTVAGSGRVGSRGATAGDNGAATEATIGLPRAVTVDANGNLYIATQLNRIRAVKGPVN